jgi:uroporphyrinogen III methyltransferase / synthase
MPKGKVYLVGAGPGDPGLLTLRGKEVLSQADVVVYDALVHPRILEFIPDKARKIFRGSRGKKGALSQSQINGLLVKLGKKGKRVVRLKGGDPFVFGRGAEEALALAENKVPFEIVPGVTSAIAVPAYGGIPVTDRAMNSTFTVVTGHEDPSKNSSHVDWRHLANDEGTLIFLMGLHSLPQVCERLVNEGKSPRTPAAVIQWGATPRQRMVRGTLETLPEITQKADFQPPATVIVGKVVDLADSLQWFSRKPLLGLRILVTRGRASVNYLSAMLAEEGAEVVEIPTIEIRPLPLTSRGKNILRKISSYDWLVFTSSNAVEIFMNHLFKLKMDIRNLWRIKTACVGTATAKTLRNFGIRADLIPDDYKQEGLIKSFKKLPLKGKRILFARAKEGREVLLEFFKKKAAVVDLWPLYENRVPAGTAAHLRDLFRKGGGVDLASFASSSAVDHFYSIFTPSERKKWLRGLPAAVIGPVTAASVRKWQGKVIVQPKKFTLSDLVRAVSKWAQTRKN